jgi:hypothetical protein
MIDNRRYNHFEYSYLSVTMMTNYMYTYSKYQSIVGVKWDIGKKKTASRYKFRWDTLVLSNGIIIGATKAQYVRYTDYN